MAGRHRFGIGQSENWLYPVETIPNYRKINKTISILETGTAFANLLLYRVSLFQARLSRTSKRGRR